MREKKHFTCGAWLVPLLVAAPFVAVAGCADVFGLGGYSFDAVASGDGGQDGPTDDSSLGHPDAPVGDGAPDGPAAPTCTDKIANGTETDIDCGGTCAAKCAAKKNCLLASDCEPKLACVDLLCLS